MSDYEEAPGSDAGTSEEERDGNDSDRGGEESLDSGSESDGEDEGVPGLGVVWLPIIGEDAGCVPWPYTGVPGAKHVRIDPEIGRPIDYFNLFFTDEFVQGIVDETNRYARQWVETHEQYLRDHPRSMVHLWIKQGNTTVEEVRAFIGIVLNMGLIIKPNIKAYWQEKNPSQATPWFLQHFSRDRFQLLLKFIHFADNDHLPNQQDPGYKLYKIQMLITHFQQVFPRHYHPNQNVCIDESMIGYKGKTPHLRQFMPNKRHARFGIKLWCLSDSENGYLCRFEVYKGAAPRNQDANQHGPTHELVMRLMTEADLLNRGHHLCVDNYFSSPALFQELHTAHTTATGTVRKNRKGLPKQSINARLHNKEVSERRKGPLLCVTYQDGSRKPVLLSTAVSAGYKDVRRRRAEPIERPKCVALYNKKMGGVDLGDAQLYMYLSERKTMKWTTKVALSLFGRAILNSYILYSSHTTQPVLSRYKFMVAIVEELAGYYYPPMKVQRRRRSAEEIRAARENPQQLQVAVGEAAAPPHPLYGHDLVKLPAGRKRNCAAGHANRVRSGWECHGCDIGLCPGCFAEYHRQPRRLQPRLVG